MDTEAFFARLRAFPPRDPALHTARSVLSFATLLDAVERLANTLLQQQVQTLASVLPNSPAWVITDLAALRAGIVHVPLPLFFTEAQRAFAIAAAGADAILTPHSARSCAGTAIAVGLEQLVLSRGEGAGARKPAGTRKITFTSGTTGTPKGVCLGEQAMLAVADGLAQALAPVAVRRHLCALPLAVLLENIAGVYAPLLAGATVILPAAGESGLSGSSTFDPAALNAAVQRYRAESVILLPQMLRAWSAWRMSAPGRPKRESFEREREGSSMNTRAAALPTLKFAAVGGARVGTAALADARRAGLPAYEGYGLSEAGSVQALNLPHADRPGSAGRALPHAGLRVDDRGQVWVSGALMLGYLGAPQACPDDWWPTGDLGHIDGEGFLHIDGRQRNVLITSFGRNVSPEWVEAELQAAPQIAQAVVHGDGEPRLSAVLWPAAADPSDGELAQAVATANARLPDYAQIAHWQRGRLPFNAESGMATANGRPQREAVVRLHARPMATEITL